MNTLTSITDEEIALHAKHRDLLDSQVGRTVVVHIALDSDSPIHGRFEGLLLRAAFSLDGSPRYDVSHEMNNITFDPSLIISAEKNDDLEFNDGSPCWEFTLNDLR